MPYSIKKTSGGKPFKIIRTADGKVVGSSVSKAKAAASILARMSGEERKH